VSDRFYCFLEETCLFSDTTEHCEDANLDIVHLRFCGKLVYNFLSNF